MRALLSDLLNKKKRKWNSLVKCQNEFEDIKKILISDLSLVHFNPGMDIVVPSDSSEYGIEAVLLHKYKVSSTCFMFTDSSRKKA